IGESPRMPGNLGGLASLAGINLDPLQGASDIPPSLYPRIIKSVNFKKALLQTSIAVSDSPDSITFSSYFLHYHDPGLLSTLKDYTIGLPKLIIKNLRGKSDVNFVGLESDSSEEAIVGVGEDEYQLMLLLEDLLELKINEEDGSIEIYFQMPEAYAAAQMAQKTKNLLQKYIVDFKIRKAQDHLDFIKKTYDEKKKEFILAQNRLASFRERNQNVVSPTFFNEEERLLAEYNLISGIYNELAKQVETAKIQVTEVTPNFMVIQPATIPNIPSSPKRLLILFVAGFLGAFFGLIVVFARQYISEYNRVAAA